MEKTEFWTVLDTKMFSDGTIASTATNKLDYPHALNVYYNALAVGATDGSPYHATYLISSKSGVQKTNIYERRDDPAPEPESVAE